MSKEAVKQFIDKIKQDEAFAEKIVAGKDKNERLALARAEGYDFSTEEFNEMAEKGEIDLDQTAGASDFLCVPARGSLNS